MKRSVLTLLSFLLTIFIYAQKRVNDQTTKINIAADKIEEKCIAWRRDIHEHPELGNNEYRTAKLIADHLRSLGIEVKEGVAKTGVIGILNGAKPGPCIALRADMDGLPVVERVDLPFASKVKSTYNGKEVGVMHACGHDTHVAMLMSVAEILAKEGVMENPKVDAIVGFHIESYIEVGRIEYKPGAFMASSDWFTITVKGQGSHGSQPWLGVDPIAISGQIIQGLQNIVSRRIDLTKAPAVITIGKIEGGVRNNIIPEECVLHGTIRTLDSKMRLDIHEKMKMVAANIAIANGATAETVIDEKTLVTSNDSTLLKKLIPSLEKAAGKDNVTERNWVTGAEDFSYYGLKAPAVFLYLGGMPKGKDPRDAPAHHTADFFVDESGMKTGVKAFCNIVFDYLNMSAISNQPSHSKKPF
jgi:metal-dependent amidase/aminoacylase/carboxypeptidase family protein